MRGDGDHQLVLIFLFRVGYHRHVQQRNKTQAGKPAHGLRISLRYFASQKSGLTIVQPDASLVFAVRDDRYAIIRLTRERSNLQLELQTDRSVAVDGGFGLDL